MVAGFKLLEIAGIRAGARRFLVAARRHDAESARTRCDRPEIHVPGGQGAQRPLTSCSFSKCQFPEANTARGQSGRDCRRKHRKTFGRAIIAVTRRPQRANLPIARMAVRRGNPQTGCAGFAEVADANPSPAGRSGAAGSAAARSCSQGNKGAVGIGILTRLRYRARPSG